MPSRGRRAWECGWLAGIGLSVLGVGFGLVGGVAKAGGGGLGTTRKDFFAPGTQPLQLTDDLIDPGVCASCHGEYAIVGPPHDAWAHSMMAQAGRDPVFFAALSIAEKDAPYIGDYCLRCHVPAAWLAGHVTATNGSMLSPTDQQGVSCSVCHRLVDPDYTPGVDPDADATILANLTTAIPLSQHNAAMVIDPEDRRRGPYDLDADWEALYPGSGGFPAFHRFEQSPFHRSSRMCATCHDVSNPVFTKQPDGSFALNGLNMAHPTGDKHDMFPEQRTYSEWTQSVFAQGPVDLGGRFGGTLSAVASCQDCHMPQETTQACALSPPVRADNKLHYFSGANTWVLRAVRQTYFDTYTGMNAQGVEDAIARNVSMLQRASDLSLTGDENTLTARITNYTGHKLPTGYNEGRRMWINVLFFDQSHALIAERGGYDDDAATLDEATTKVYEAKLGIDSTLASLTGQPAGETLRLALANTREKDNRIPPMGFTNAGLEAVGAGSVPTGLYPDGQHWDETEFAVPPGAVSATVNVYYQTTSREYIEFLRDAQDPGDTLGVQRGMQAYNLWEMFGKSEPVLMDTASIVLVCPCDFNHVNGVTVQDIFDFLTAWLAGNASADFNGVNGVTVQDIFDFLTCWLAGCS